jgi:hypothetical protein
MFGRLTDCMSLAVCDCVIRQSKLLLLTAIGGQGLLILDACIVMRAQNEQPVCITCSLHWYLITQKHVSSVYSSELPAADHSYLNAILFMIPF